MHLVGNMGYRLAWTYLASILRSLWLDLRRCRYVDLLDLFSRRLCTLSKCGGLIDGFVHTFGLADFFGTLAPRLVISLYPSSA